MATITEFNSSYTGLRLELLRHVSGPGARVLDLGCATGANGRYLREQGIASFIAGIELDAGMAAEAGPYYDQIEIGNLDHPEILKPFEGIVFDHILAGDVFEHLADPWRLMRELRRHLAPDGKLIISVPNIQHLETFIQLYLHGYWPSNERGLFDRTHLRFLTRRNLLEWIDQTGYRLLSLERKFRFRDRVGSAFPLHSGFVLKRLFPNLFTHQYIAVCAPRENAFSTEQPN